MRKEFFIENYSVKTYRSKHGHAMVLIKMSDVKGDFNVVIPASYLAKIIAAHNVRSEDVKPQIAHPQSERTFNRAR